MCDTISILLGCSVSDECTTSKMAKSAAKSAAKRGISSAFMQTTAGKAVGSSVYHGTRQVVNAACATEVGKKAVASLASGVAEKSLAGAASRTVVSSAMKGNVVAAGVGMVISSVGDTKDYIDGKISGGQYAKRLGSNAAGVGGGVGGWAAGAAAGAVFGPVGTVIGGFIGGVAGSAGASSLFDSIFVD